MTDQAPKTAAGRARFEARGLVIGIAVMVGLFVAFSFMDQIRYPGQERAEARSAATLLELGAPASLEARLPAGHDELDLEYVAAFDTTTGAAMVQFAYGAAAAKTLESKLDDGTHACPEVEQYWRVDTDFWCTDQQLRRRCTDAGCTYYDTEARRGYVRVSPSK